MITFGKNIQNRRVALGLDVSELAQLAIMLIKVIQREQKIKKCIHLLKNFQIQQKHYLGEQMIYLKMLNLKKLKQCTHINSKCYKVYKIIEKKKYL